MLTAIEGFHHPSYIEPDEEYRQQRIDYTLAALETASDLGLPYISIEPGGPIPDGKSREWAMDTFVESLEEVIPKAEAAGVDLLVEPEPDLLIETSDEFLALLERVDSERVKCNFDAGHFYCVGEDPAELVEPLWEHTRHYHLEDIPADRTHEHTQLGDGAMDIDAFLGELEDRGYDGFVTVELYPTRRRRSRPARGDGLPRGTRVGVGWPAVCRRIETRTWGWTRRRRRRRSRTQTRGRTQTRSWTQSTARAKPNPNAASGQPSARWVNWSACRTSSPRRRT